MDLSTIDEFTTVEQIDDLVEGVRANWRSYSSYQGYTLKALAQLRKIIEEQQPQATDGPLYDRIGNGMRLWETRDGKGVPWFWLKDEPYTVALSQSHTYMLREILKASGARWSGSEKAWYWTRRPAREIFDLVEDDVDGEQPQATQPELTPPAEDVKTIVRCASCKLYFDQEKLNEAQLCDKCAERKRLETAPTLIVDATTEPYDVYVSNGMVLDGRAVYGSTLANVHYNNPDSRIDQLDEFEAMEKYKRTLVMNTNRLHEIPKLAGKRIGIRPGDIHGELLRDLADAARAKTWKPGEYTPLLPFYYAREIENILLQVVPAGEDETLARLEVTAETYVQAAQVLKLWQERKAVLDNEQVVITVKWYDHQEIVEINEGFFYGFDATLIGHTIATMWLKEKKDHLLNRYSCYCPPLPAEKPNHQEFVELDW